MIFIHSGNDVLYESTCSIISTNLPTLTTDGGTIINGTQNVTVYCLCMRGNAAIGGTRWYFPNGTLVRQDDNQVQIDSIYYRNTVPSQLIIPTFINPYTVTYSCIQFHNFDELSDRGDTITLNLLGMLNLILILWYTYVYVCIEHYNCYKKSV